MIGLLICVLDDLLRVSLTDGQTTERMGGLSSTIQSCYLFGVIVQVRVVFRKTVVGDWRFDYLSGSHLQSQVKSRHQMMVFMLLVLVLIGQFCHDVIGCQNVKVVVIGRLLLLLYLVRLVFVGFVWGRVWVVFKVHVAVDIGSEVLVLSLPTSFLIYSRV